MSDARKGSSRPFVVTSERAFSAIRHWLKEHGCNTYSYSRSDIINVGYDTKRDSDHGGRYEHRGYIIVKDPTLFDRTRQEIEKAYGWNKEQAA